MSAQPRLVEVRKNVLKQNDLIARALRERFREAGVLVVSLVSSPGSGKTAFLEKTLTRLHSRHKVAALVGNLVCPSSYDLGEDLRFVLLSVTEGEDKPLKYPTIFNSADVAIITKSDLADAVDFDEAAARRNIRAVRPGMEIFKLSAKTGEGMVDCLEFLDRRRTHSRAAAAF